MAAIAGGGRTHPTFVEIGTNKPLYVHRTGSNVVNGRYYVDKDPKKTLGHYSAFRRVDTADLRARIRPHEAVAGRGDEGIAARPGATGPAVPRYVTVSGRRPEAVAGRRSSAA